jgi:hypothetical protein
VFNSACIPSLFACVPSLFVCVCVCVCVCVSSQQEALKELKAQEKKEHEKSRMSKFKWI